MNLSELVDTHRGGRTYPELSRDCGGTPSPKRLQQIVTAEIRNFPDPPTIEALARGLRVSHGAVVLAAAASLGLSIDQSTPRLFELLGSTAHDLSEQEAGAVAYMVRTFVDARPGEQALPEGGQPVEPKVADVLAERRRRGTDLETAARRGDGPTRGQRDRAEADRAGEPPADDPTDLEPR